MHQTLAERLEDGTKNPRQKAALTRMTENEIDLPVPRDKKELTARPSRRAIYTEALALGTIGGVIPHELSDDEILMLALTAAQATLKNVDRVFERVF